MPRARNIKPGFFSNEELAECTPWARLCFAGLWLLADREGRLEDRPKRIKGELFAFDSVEIEPLLDELARHGFIQRYAPNGHRFIQVLNFKKHQYPHIKEVASTIPAPQSPVFDPSPSTTKPGVQPPSDGIETPDKHQTSTSFGPQESQFHGALAPPDILNPESLFPESPIPSSAPPRRKSDAKASSLSSAGADSSAEPTPDVPELKTVTKAKTTKPAKKGSPTPTIPCPYAKIIALYHEKLPTLARVKVDSQARHAEMRKLWGFVLRTCKSDGTRRAETADQALAWIGEYFERASANDFLMGRNRRPTDGHWQADFDYLLKERGMRQVIEKTLVAGGTA